MSERIKLILLRLWLAPYFIVSLICTILLTMFACCGYALLGIPCWIITGHASSWIPDWNIDWCPTLFKWEEFQDDIKYRQLELDKKRNK